MVVQRITEAGVDPLPTDCPKPPRDTQITSTKPKETKMNWGWIAFTVLLLAVLYVGYRYGWPILVDLYKSATGK
jgi:hypothetical protein